MAAAHSTQVRTVQGDTADLLCWRYYGRTAGVAEQLLEANPGLADLGPELPSGTLVTLPPQPTTPTQAARLQLWD